MESLVKCPYSNLRFFSEKRRYCRTLHIKMTWLDIF